jgi:hypothetical protein
MLLLKDAIAYYEKVYFKTKEEELEVVPTLEEIHSFELCEKQLHRLIRRMRRKRRLFGGFREKGGFLYEK